MSEDKISYKIINNDYMDIGENLKFSTNNLFINPSIISINSANNTSYLNVKMDVDGRLLKSRLKEEQIEYCLKNGEIKNGIIYGTFKFVYDSNIYKLCNIKSDQYKLLMLKNEIKSSNVKIKHEFYKLYRSKNSKNPQFLYIPLDIYIYIDFIKHTVYNNFIEITLNKNSSWIKELSNMDQIKSISVVDKESFNAFEEIKCSDININLILNKAYEYLQFRKCIYGKTLEEVNSKIILNNLL